MYNRKHWVKYEILHKRLKMGGPAITVSTKTKKHSAFWTWCGIFTEQEVKDLLSSKQFKRWQDGTQTEFIRYSKGKQYT